MAATKGWSTVAAVAALYLILQAFESYVLLPLIMKREVRIPALVTVLSVVLWRQLLGLPVRYRRFR